jgi:uncharacterized membrane protein
MSLPLISADNHWAVWAILFATAAFGLWAETTRWGSRLSGAVVAIGTTFILSNAGIIPVSAPAFDTVWSFFIPLAIPLLLFKADLRRIIRESGPTLIAFLIGALGTVLGTILAFYTIPLGPEGHKLAGIFCATYVGGSVNYVAAAQALEMRSGDLLTAGIAADNLVMTLYFLLLFALPSWGWLRRWMSRGSFPESEVKRTSQPAQVSELANDGKGFPLLDAAFSIAIAAFLCAVGFGLASLFSWPSGSILIVTLLAVILAALFPNRMGRLESAQPVGILLMMVFFAVLGATANIMVVIEQGVILFFFAALILLVHLVLLLSAGKLLRLDLLEIVIASNANMGGPTTAAAMATARNWNHLVTPAILCGTLGYATATFIGTAVGLWLGGV